MWSRNLRCEALGCLNVQEESKHLFSYICLHVTTVKECCDLNPCWVGLKFRARVIFARTRRSTTFEIIDRRDNGR